MRDPRLAARMFDLHLVRPNWAVVTTSIPSTEDDDGDVCFESTGQAVRSGSNGEGFRAPASYISLECDGQCPKTFTEEANPMQPVASVSLEWERNNTREGLLSLLIP